MAGAGEEALEIPLARLRPKMTQKKTELGETNDVQRGC